MKIKTNVKSGGGHFSDKELKENVVKVDSSEVLTALLKS